MPTSPIKHVIAEPDAVERVMVRPSTACAMLDCGPTRLYQLIKDGELESFTDGRRRCISVASIYDYNARCLAHASKAPAGSTAKQTAASLASRKTAREPEAV